MAELEPDKIFNLPTLWVVFLIVVLPGLALGALIALSYAVKG